MKKGLFINPQLWALVDQLEKEEQAVLFLAIEAYHLGQQPPELGPIGQTILKLIENDNPKFSREHRAAVSEVRRQAVSKRYNTKLTNETNLSICSGVPETKPKRKKALKQDENEQDFERLWLEYPRKEGKTQALKAFKKSLKAGASFEEIRKGLLAYVDNLRRNGTEYQYTKTGGNFFSGELWRDDWSGQAFQKGKTKREEIEKMSMENYLRLIVEEGEQNGKQFDEIADY